MIGFILGIGAVGLVAIGIYVAFIITSGFGQFRS